MSLVVGFLHRFEEVCLIQNEEENGGFVWFGFVVVGND